MAPLPKGRGERRSHFYRQDSDGLWSHKPDGEDPITRLDDNDNLIIDPQMADSRYTFVGYFMITPWNDYYSD